MRQTPTALTVIKAIAAADVLRGHPAHLTRGQMIQLCQRWLTANERTALVAESKRLADAARAILARDAKGHVCDATHRCKVCGALWRLGPSSPITPGGAWCLRSPKAGACCDNAVMGDQIEQLSAARAANGGVR